LSRSSLGHSSRDLPFRPGGDSCLGWYYRRRLTTQAAFCFSALSFFESGRSLRRPDHGFDSGRGRRWRAASNKRWVRRSGQARVSVALKPMFHTTGAGKSLHQFRQTSSAGCTITRMAIARQSLILPGSRKRRYKRQDLDLSKSTTFSISISCIVGHF
jgi:hypothetical protein